MVYEKKLYLRLEVSRLSISLQFSKLPTFEQIYKEFNILNIRFYIDVCWNYHRIFHAFVKTEVHQHVHKTLYWARLLQATFSFPLTQRLILILYIYLGMRLVILLFSFSSYTFVWISNLSHTCYLSSLSHPPFFVHLKTFSEELIFLNSSFFNYIQYLFT